MGVQFQRQAKYLPAKIMKGEEDELTLEFIDKPVRIRKVSQEYVMEDADNGVYIRPHLGQKRYTSTCYFQPKQIPVMYSETMILKIGSTKKRYFESIYYENKLVPFHWSESMHANLDYEVCKSEVRVPCDQNYVSLRQPEENGK